ncbi:hypothetical protein GIB67_039658 [Kingdonia uniflora]|uniref:Cyclin N-terminal domain-containing protein n=1 Tax=Kingdonia uniflora TaxID=39325 RepID=A0A7J7MDK7_9MAGN|nr:hypothetical protein GIB67_039658 [Kingdonia uniflora]
MVKTETVVIRRSILSARNKVACGLTGKPKNPIVGIDAENVDNQLSTVGYVKYIFKFYMLAGNSRRVHDYMDSKAEIIEKMRAILFNWHIEVHIKFELMPETLYLTTYIVN